MQALLSRFPGLAVLPRVDLGVRPSPVEAHRIDGLDLLVKRDDLCCPRHGGNKARCLEFLLTTPAERILTFSTLGAHHAYATAVHAASLGKRTVVVLVRRGQRGRKLERLHEVAAGIVEVDSSPGAVLAALQLWQRGTRIIPPGGMSARGALGYVAAAFELDPPPARIYLPLGTGTTASGLLAGLMLREAETEVVAVRVAERVAGWGPLVWRRAFRAAALLRRADPTVPRARRGRVRLRVEAAEGRYGEETDAVRRTRAAASRSGIELEATYSGPALARLLAERAEAAMYLQTYCPAG